MAVNYEKIKKIKSNIVSDAKIKSTVEYNEGFDDCMNGCFRVNPYTNISYDKKMNYSRGFQDAQQTMNGTLFDCE